MKIYNLARLMRDAHEIHLIAIAENGADLSYKAELEQVFHKVDFVYVPKWKSILNVLAGIFSNIPLQVAYFKSKKFSALLHAKIEEEQYSVIHVQHLRMSQFIQSQDRSHAVLDLPDAFSLYWKRRAEKADHIFKAWFARMEYRRLLSYEKKVLPGFPLNLVCSPEDKKHLEENTHAHIQVLPNGVDVDLFTREADSKIIPNRILFTGNMDYEPNVDAVCYFVEEIFPLVLNKIPDAVFVIAGQRPVAKVRKLADSNVIITGFVENMSTEYSKASVVVAPLRFGAGTQNKVLEAMSIGVPVVCTEIGFLGLGVESGQGAILAADKASFAREVVQILNNLEYRNRISKTGRDIIVSIFSWQAVSKKLEDYLAQTAKTNRN